MMEYQQTPTFSPKPSDRRESLYPSSNLNITAFLMPQVCLYKPLKQLIFILTTDAEQKNNHDHFFHLVTAVP